MSRDDRPSLATSLPRAIRARVERVRNRLVGGGESSERADQRAEAADERRRTDERPPPGADEIGRRTEQVLTPEERVVEIVSRNGGSMKQSDIVATFEWSESTVSRKLSKLESADAITRYQIGREKLVFLPGSEPESLESPLARADAD